MKIIPLILCGGRGTSFGLYQESYPKQFIALHGESNKTLLQNSERISDLDGIEEPIIVCNEEHRFGSRTDEKY